MSKNNSVTVDKGEINDANGLSLTRLIMMAVTASVCGGIFSLSGDMAAGGANTGAVLMGWAICFVGVFSLMMCFYGLTHARPDLFGGIYSYAAAGFGDFIGFNSAYGYWISSCLTNASFSVLLFLAFAYFFPAFGSGNNALSCLCASAILWLFVLLVSRGVKEAAGINIIVAISKLIPLGLFIVSILMAGKFDVAVFMDNFWGEPNGPGLLTQINSTMIALVWVFVGIEGAVAISGRAKYVKDSGRATIIAFGLIFALYLIISVESMGVMPRAQMAELATPSMAGILEYAIGPIGATIVNAGIVISLAGAMLGYVIISSENPHEAAILGVFPQAFAKKNSKGAPIVTLIVSALITQSLLLMSVFAASTYQFFYTCAVSTCLIPYIASTAYYMKISYKGKYVDPKKLTLARVVGTLGFIYSVYLFWAAGLSYVLITTIIFGPGVLLYIWGQKGRGKEILPSFSDKIIAVAIVIMMIVSIALIASGTIAVF